MSVEGKAVSRPAEGGCADYVGVPLPSGTSGQTAFWKELRIYVSSAPHGAGHTACACAQ